MPLAVTRTRTSRGPMSGTRRSSRTSGWPTSYATTTFMGIPLPIRSETVAGRLAEPTAAEARVSEDSLILPSCRRRRHSRLSERFLAYGRLGRATGAMDLVSQILCRAVRRCAAMDYQLIDADEHYYEPDDCFSRHIEARFKDETISVRRGADGLGRIFLRGQRTFMSVMPGDYASAPGALEGLFAGEVADGFTHREVINARDHPAFTEKAARLALMNAQGIEAAIMLPTLGVAVEYDMRDDVELTYASLRAFNRWLEEDWGYGADGRIFAVPMLSLLDISRAVAELNRVIEADARLVHQAGDRKSTRLNS